jgi:hypothetical protein
MRYLRFTPYAVFLVPLLLLTACGSSASPVKPQETVTISQSFQAQLSPVPTVPPYRCGAWSSNNAPGTNSSIFIYARLTKNLFGVAGVSAQAVVHFKDFDVTLDPQTSDDRGYVAFPLSLQGRQPGQVPATVDVTFSASGKNITCTAFFTPQ